MLESQSKILITLNNVGTIKHLMNAEKSDEEHKIKLNRVCKNLVLRLLKEHIRIPLWWFFTWT